jgi:hypothetical protein
VPTERDSPMSDDPILAALSGPEAGQTALRSDLTARMDHLEAGQGEMRADIAGLSRDTAARAVEAADFREQALNRLTAIREDIGVNMARVDRVADTNADIRAELVSLRVENAALGRMIKALETRVEQIETPGQ